MDELDELRLTRAADLEGMAKSLMTGDIAVEKVDVEAEDPCRLADG